MDDGDTTGAVQLKVMNQEECLWNVFPEECILRLWRKGGGVTFLDGR
jgi:hypothetical protein